MVETASAHHTHRLEPIVLHQESRQCQARQRNPSSPIMSSSRGSPNHPTNCNSSFSVIRDLSSAKQLPRVCTSNGSKRSIIPLTSMRNGGAWLARFTSAAIPSSLRAATLQASKKQSSCTQEQVWAYLYAGSKCGSCCLRLSVVSTRQSPR